METTSNLTNEEINAYYAPIEWTYINTEEESNTNSLITQINYYDSNTALSCKIIGTISLQKTSIATNLILAVYFDKES